MIRFATSIVCAALVMSACSSGERPAVPTTGARTPVVSVSTEVPPTAVTTESAPEAAPSSTEPAPSSTTAPEVVPPELADLERLTVRVGSADLDVVVARTSTERSLGLMHVASLGPLDGMLFVWESDTTTSFWMFNTFIPLDIAWFDASGAFVWQTTMVPCTDFDGGDDCIRYGASAPYRYALEVPAGHLDLLGDAPRLAVAGLD